MKYNSCLVLIGLLWAVSCQSQVSSARQEKAQADILQHLNTQLKSGAWTTSQVLTNPEWMKLHSLTAFRELIKVHAKSEPLTITVPDEPGLKTTIKAKATDRNGAPMADVLVYFYQTDTKGWYADTAAHVRMNEGDMRHARLFGYVKTDREGKFEFHTIRPNGYPNSELPAHIHLHFWRSDGTVVHGMPDELLFEEDERLTPERKKAALSSGFIISKNTGTIEQTVYEYQLTPRY
ncbi:MAG: hypothetical protein JNJ57_20470 [Saprospiraceae bacterium]|nr:hypothetical protein [Saprospiraceae bacterium]